MQIHRIRGRDLQEALHKARKLHGEDALVLGHEPAPGGGVTLAVGRSTILFREVGPRGTLPRPPASGAEGEPVHRGLADVERVLLRGGASAELVALVCERIRSSGASGAFALDEAAEAIGALVPIAPSPRIARTGAAGAAGTAAPRMRIFALVGPAGAGKTTTLLKLASRLAQAGRRASLVTLDVQRPGAVEHLAAFARLLQVPLDAAGDGRSLARAVARAGAADVVLVDTSGSAGRDAEALRALAADLEGRADRALDAYLVLSAASASAALEQAQRAFAATSPTALVVTRLDETRRPAPALEVARRAGLPLAFLCDGRDVARHLHRPKASALADLFLRGRLA